MVEEEEKQHYSVHNDAVKDDETPLNNESKQHKRLDISIASGASALARDATDQNEKQDELRVYEDEAQRLMQTLPKTTMTGTRIGLVNYQGFWCLDSSRDMASILSFQTHFRARDTDLIIAGFPKTGNTWLMSLLFLVVNREKYRINQSPLLNNHPHELVRRLELQVYGNALDYPRAHRLNELPSPRLSHTHLPYVSLPNSIKDSKCKVIFISRNPMDTIVSFWYFTLNAIKTVTGENVEYGIEDCFEEFIQGKVMFGPFFDHVLEYWKQSLEHPEKVLFLKYEDLKDDPIAELKKLAEFVGMPFSPQEENEGVIKEIIEFCRINNMKEMEGNKSGVINKVFEKKSFFRKGEVGGWTQYFTPSMVERMNKLMNEKLEGTGLSFKLRP
ncbi:cytosolic sulfotransferase 5-like [Silene latifolia]|uniref:cytosolic sulfotransferase 5-like n=1 Tax=Silene latifolia TaxID=37657 RepID=UPI003D76C53E